ncbi:MAG: hypothetical protein H6842_04200 [Rhodospirillaceae bacterium]|nr:hypothetical protein [Rhodospirillaceae bacterium]
MLNEYDLIRRVRRLSLDQLRLWIDDGWLRPDPQATQVAFTEVDVARAELICHLRLDLDVNDEAMPVVLSLLDQLYSTRHQLRIAAEAIGHLPADARDRLVAELRRRLTTDH